MKAKLLKKVRAGIKVKEILFRTYKIETKNYITYCRPIEVKALERQLTLLEARKRFKK